MNPWPVDAEVEESHLPRPGHADLAGLHKYGFTRRAQRPRARERARDGGARRGRLARQGVPARARRVESTATCCGSRRSRRPSPTTSARTTSTASTNRRSAASTRTPSRDGRGDQPPAEGEREPRRRLRGARVRAHARARLARELGGAPRLAPGAGDRLDPGGQGRRGRRGVGRRRPARLRVPRRDLLLRRARLAPRDEPRGRRRGRDDERRDARRQGRDQADLDAHQAASLGRHGDQGAGAGDARAHRLDRRARCRASSARRWSRWSSRACYREKFGGDHIADVLAALRAYEERIGWRR